MTNFVLLAALSLLSLPTFCAIEGKTYVRKVTLNGKNKTHDLNFGSDKVVDNGGWIFFGQPAKSYPYTQDGEHIYVTRSNSSTEEYVLASDGNILTKKTPVGNVEFFVQESPLSCSAYHF